MKNKIQLNDVQIKYLKIFHGYKSFARQEYLRKELGPDYKTVEEQLITMGILKRNKAGALSSIPWDSVKLLIYQNTKTLEQIEQEIIEAQNLLKEAVDKDIRLSKEDPNYCFYSRDVQSSISFRREQLNKLLKLKTDFNQ